MPASSAARFLAFWLAIPLLPGLRAWPQQPSDAAASAVQVKVSTIVQPALSEVESSISALNIPRWKAPGEVKGAAQGNAASIQRDLTDTLPGLLSQADAAPGAVPPGFAVYRNLDALYDVLLRVYGTASLAAPPNEADSLFSALQKLEAARAQLGDTILSHSRQNEAHLVKLEAALKAAASAPSPSPPSKPTVIDDGPCPSSSVRKKKKPATKPPAGTSGATQNPGG